MFTTVHLACLRLGQWKKTKQLKVMAKYWHWSPWILSTFLKRFFLRKNWFFFFDFAVKDDNVEIFDDKKHPFFIAQDMVKLELMKKYQKHNGDFLWWFFHLQRSKDVNINYLWPFKDESTAELQSQLWVIFRK